MKLENSSWLQVEEYFKHRDLVVVPLGSVENHGSHMGLGTDFIIPAELADRLQQRTNVLSIPSLPFGMADHHTDFPGTLSIGDDGLYLVMSRIISQLYQMGARKILFINGHGGNTPALTRVSLAMEKKGMLCAIVDWWVLAGQLRDGWKGGHAGAVETAAMMHVRPEAVHMELAMESRPADLSADLTYGGAGQVLCQGIPVQVPRQIRHIVEAGWFGPDDIQTAGPEWGQEMLDAVTDFLEDFISKFEDAARMTP